jgi:biopolymer transport protein ExbD
MRKLLTAVQEEFKMDMTPMIDVVFNLVIFFMLVTDINQKDLADLVLPVAHMAAEDKGDDPDDRLIINVDKKGQVLVKGQPTSLEQLSQYLETARDRYNKRMQALGKSGTEIVEGGGEASKLYVLLRADKETPWQHVQYIMTIMAEAKLYKLQFATKQYLDGQYLDTSGKFLDESDANLGGRTREQALAAKPTG